jgi:hypothetical protein
LTGSDFGDLKTLYPNMYKLKAGENPIKSLDVFKPLTGGNLKKLELQGTDAAKKSNYRDELFKTLNLEVVDGLNKGGDEVDSTIYDEGDEDFDEEDFEGNFPFKFTLILLNNLDGEFDEEEFEDEEDYDEDDEDDDEDEEPAPKGKKQRRE